MSVSTDTCSPVNSEAKSVVEVVVEVEAVPGDIESRGESSVSMYSPSVSRRREAVAT